MEQNQVVILDIRYTSRVSVDDGKLLRCLHHAYHPLVSSRAPSLPVAELYGHTQCVNTIAWAPHSSCHICTGGDDRQALIWDLTAMPKPITGNEYQRKRDSWASIFYLFFSTPMSSNQMCGSGHVSKHISVLCRAHSRLPRWRRNQYTSVELQPTRMGTSRNGFCWHIST